MKTIHIAGSTPVNLVELGANKAGALLVQLSNAGFQLTTQFPADCFLAIDHNRCMLSEFFRTGGKPKDAILVRLEPVSVHPIQYTSSVESKYCKIVSPGMLVETTSMNIGWPYAYHPNPNTPSGYGISLDSIIQKESFYTDRNIVNWRRRPIQLSMISANKVSPLKTDNYSIRREAAFGISKEILQVYGPLWNDKIAIKFRHRLAVAWFALRQGVRPNLRSLYGNLFRTYPAALGPIVDKQLIIKKSKFSLVVENSNSYVSEKLFDVIMGGAVPIYVGPSLVDVGLPGSIALVSSGKPNEVLRLIKSVSENEIELVLAAGRDFLNSDEFKDNWQESSVYSRIFDEIQTTFS